MSDPSSGCSGRRRAVLTLIWLLCLLASVIASIWMALAILAGSPRAWHLAIAHDQLANAAFGGDPDETISSRAAKAMMQGRRWGCLLCRLLDSLDPGHCARSIETDRGDSVTN